MFTDCKNNRFQKKLMNSRIYEYQPPTNYRSSTAPIVNYFIYLSHFISFSTIYLSHFTFEYQCEYNISVVYPQISMSAMKKRITVMTSPSVKIQMEVTRANVPKVIQAMVEIVQVSRQKIRFLLVQHDIHNYNSLHDTHYTGNNSFHHSSISVNTSITLRARGLRTLTL